MNDANRNGVPVEDAVVDQEMFYCSVTAGNSVDGDCSLSYTMPQAEYMYGCVATAVGMLLGYYDLYGYCSNGVCYNFSNLIEGNISVDSRGSDGKSIYDMADPSVLARFIASEDYVDRFYGTSASSEKKYSFVNGDPAQGLNISQWDCLADYLGTGQYWRGNDDLSTCYYFGSLADISSGTNTFSVGGEKVPVKYSDFKYGLSLYVESRGFKLDAENTISCSISDFSFEDYMAEIDAGRAVLLSMSSGSGGHMVVAYGYNEDTYEVIFDDTYRSDCRMKWNGTYEYAGDHYRLNGVSTIVFDTANVPPAFDPGEWNDDYDEALAYAKANNVLILAYYGNRKTCGYCAAWEDEIASTDEFELYRDTGSIVLLKNVKIPGVTYSGTPAFFLIDGDGKIVSKKSGYSSDWMTWFTDYVTLAGGDSKIDLSATAPIIATRKGASVSSTVIEAGDEIYLSFDVTNSGKESSGSKFTVLIYLDNKLVSTLTVPVLAAGGSYKVRDLAVGKMESGDHEWRITVDNGNAITESSEANNRQSGCFFVEYPDEYRKISSSVWIRNNTTSSHLLVVQSGRVYVSGGKANDVILTSSGLVNVMKTGYASKVVVSSGGMFYNSGTTEDLTVMAGGSASLRDGVVSKGVLYQDVGVLYTGSAVDFDVYENAALVCYSDPGVLASDVRVHSGGEVVLGYCTFSGSPVGKDITVLSGGEMYVYSGSIISGFDIKHGGYGHVAGTIEGSNTIAGEISFSDAVRVNTNAVLKFDISERSLNDSRSFSGINYVEDANLSLIVDKNQTAGQYYLTYGCEDFAGAFSICNTSGVCYTGQSLSVNSIAKADKLTLELENPGSYLYLNVYHSGVQDFSKKVISSATHIAKYGMVISGGSFTSQGILRLGQEGVASGVSVLTSGSAYISSGGNAVGTEISGDTAIYVSSTGAQSESVLYGRMYVSSGGTASKSVVKNAGLLGVSSGGQAAGTVVSSGGIIYGYSGGSVCNTEVLSGGSVRISSGGLFSAGEIAKGGYVDIWSGGKVAGDIQVAGRISVVSGAAGSGSLTCDLRERSFGHDYLLYLSSCDADVFSSYTISVSSSQAPGSYRFLQGADFTGVNFTLLCDGKNIGTISSRNSLTVDGVTYSLQQNTLSFYLNVENPALDDLPDLSVKGDFINVSRTNGNPALVDTETAQLSFTVVNSGAADAAATVAAVYVDDVKAGTVNIAALKAGTSKGYSFDLGKLNTGYNTIRLELDNGKKVREKSEYNNQVEYSVLVSSGGISAPSGVWTYNYSTTGSLGSSIASRTVSDSYLYVYDGGTVSSAVVKKGGYLYVSSGGVVKNLNAFNGYSYIRFSGQVSSLQVSSASVYIGGAVDQATIKSRSYVHVSSGGSISSTSIFSSGSLYVSSYGSAEGVVVNSKGYLRGYDNSLISGVTVSSGGYLYLSSGSTLTGKISVASGGTVSAYRGSILRMDISGHTEDTASLINNISLVRGAPEFYVTVKADQKFGSYKLAGGAADFKGSITVCTTAGVCYDAITVGGSVSAGNRSYTLGADGGVLTLTIGSRGSVPVDPVDPVEPVVSSGLVNVYSGGKLVSGASAINRVSLTGTRNDSMVILSGGYASSVTINKDAELSVSSGGSVTNVSVSSGGLVQLLSGGKAGYVVLNNGSAHIKSAAVGELKVGSSAVAYASSGAVIGNLSLYSRGVLYLSSGAEVNGRIQHISSGGVISAASGAKITMDISSSRGGVCIDNLGRISGKPDFYVRVKDGQREGSYKLAENAADFKGSITVCTTAGICYDTITVGGSFCADEQCYALTLEDDTLTLTVTSNHSEPDVPAVSGLVNVYSGGRLVSGASLISGCQLRSGGNNSMVVSSGGIADAAVVSNGGLMRIYSGGNAENSVISSGGYLYVSRFGLAQSTTVSNGGILTVFNSGTVSDTNVRSGGIMRISGGSAIDTVVSKGGSMNLHVNGVASNVRLSSEGSLVISSGGTVAGTFVIANGAVVSACTGADIVMDLSTRTEDSGAFINNLSLINGAPDFYVTVKADQEYGSYKLASGAGTFDGSITICTTAGTCYDAISAGDRFCADDRCYALSVDKGNLLLNITSSAAAPVDPGTSGGMVHLYSGGILTSKASVLSGVSMSRGGNDKMVVFSGGVAADTVVSSGANVILSSGGKADKTDIYRDGGLHVYSGAAASNTTVYRSGYLGVGLGATTYNTTIDYAGELTVWGGGKVIGNTINTWGAIILSSGAMADSSVINSNGGLHVYSGATASNTTVNRKGFFGVGLGAQTYDTTIGYAGELTVWSGGVVHRNEINTWGAIILLDGAAANYTTINPNGGLHIYKGATAFSTEITSGATLGIGLGGTLYNSEQEAGATMTFYDGSILRGWNTFGGTVSVFSGVVDAAGAYISLDLTDRKNSDAAIMSNIGSFNQVQRFSVEVDSKQTGSYRLAAGANSFRKEMTLYVDDVDRGKIGVGKTLNYNGIDYSLLKNNGVLSLQISNAASSSYNGLSPVMEHGILAV